MIYEGESGFNLNYSGGGMWGIAVYFAKNAGYSHNYRFNCPNGDMQFFLSEVLVGDTILLASNNALRNPPLKPDGKTFYDSIKG